MDFIFIAKLLGSVLSALAAWWGFRKFRHVLKTYREVLGPRAAEPFTTLRYRWSGDLKMPRSHSLTLHLGNRERRPVIIYELLWVVPPFRLKWEAEPQNRNFTSRLEEGEGTELEFNPDSALSMIEDTRDFQGWFKRLIVVCELRLVVYLRTGELISKRAPGKMRSLLSLRHGFSWFSRFVVRVHAFVWP
jgi:hypothetical protein